MKKNLNQRLEKLKIKAVCKNMKIFEEHSKLYTAIHYLFEQGFNTEQSLAVPVKDFDAWDRVGEASVRAAISAGFNFRELTYVTRLHLDTSYREKHFERYIHEIRPLVQQIKLSQIIKYIYDSIYDGIVR